MEMTQNEADLILGGAPEAIVQEFPKVRELSVSELDLILEFSSKEVGVDMTLTNQKFYRSSQLENLAAL